MNDTTSSAGGSVRRHDGAEIDRVFEALRHPHRRQILLVLHDHHPRTADELTPEDLSDSDDDHRRFVTGLVHNHLPKLADAGYIAWDEAARVITRGQNYDEVASFITVLWTHQEELPIEWP